MVEALVAFSLLVAFSGTLGPLMFQSRGILVSGSAKVRAELLLRSLLQPPFNRLVPEIGVREGESDGLHWRIDVETAPTIMFPSDVGPAGATTNNESTNNAISWTMFHVMAEVSWGHGKVARADTLRLGAVD